MASKNIDIEDLIPAQIAGLMFLITFGIVELTAYSGAIDLEATYGLGGTGFAVSLAFIVSMLSFAVILFTNSIGVDDVAFWDDSTGLDQIYGLAIFITLALVVGVEFWPYMGEFITSSDIAGTVAWLTSVLAVWAAVWIK